MLRRALVIAATTVGLLGAAAVPALAIPPPGDSLMVLAYYADPARTQLVGERWSGCGLPSGSWGTTTSVHRARYFTPC